ncbi:hypothetical protein K9N68_14290 [Kovacikia minuta CCNUW1]|uniref:hypothetical protein n=1 Tax=Kovacikia minuta TaxID=2931930 RepID=UPI001CCC19E5|nr:hypothetical protein [Kovacikia minuta]UBF28900.1 hypothetical protein K9N68_14290 [Kovacikia minuta CCNUW1]
MLLIGEAWSGNNLWGGRWLVIPVALTLLGYRRHFWQHPLASWLSVAALFLVQPLMVDTVAGRLTSLGVATLLMLFNTRQLRHLFAAWVTVGFGLGFAAVAAWEVLIERLKIDWGMSLPAIAILVLWLLWSWLIRQETLLAGLYKRATDIWAITLTLPNLFLLTIGTFLAYLPATLEPEIHHWVLASGLMLLATSYRTWQVPFDAGYYLTAWSLELLVAGMLTLTGRSLDALAIANLALGLATQLVGDGWMRGEGRGQGAEGRRQGSQESSSPHPTPYTPHPHHLIPLLYAGFGLLLAHHAFTASTGLYTIAAALVGIGVGRRQLRFKPLTYLSVLAISFGAYELLFYQLSQAKGDRPGDAIVLLGVLAAFLAIALRLLLPWLLPYLRLLPGEILAIAHVHWAIGSIFLVGALLNPLSTQGEWGWVGVAAVLAGYALVMGHGRWGIGDGGGREDREAEESSVLSPQSSAPLSPRTPHLTPHTPHPTPQFWTYAGIIEAVLTFAYLLHLLLPDAFLIKWGGTIAAILAFSLYQVPWQSWGWQREPWRKSAATLPALATMLTAGGISLQSLLIVAAFYAWLAKAERQVRLSYLSVLLADWAAVRFLHQHNAVEPLWLAVLVGVTLLYMAQIDPDLRSPTERDKRHLLRCLATGLVSLTAFYQSEIGISGILPILVGILSIGLALGFILTGIWLRVRAFLYIGTLAFVVQILRQLWLFINDYSLVLWAVIGAMGLVFMWIAATFEARRTQMTALVAYWSSELENWE